MTSSRAVTASIFKRSSIDGRTIEMSPDFIKNGRSPDFEIIYRSVLKNIVSVIISGELVSEHPGVEKNNVHDFMDECGQTRFVVSSGGVQVVFVEDCQSHDGSIGSSIFY
jgi:hypothetical protein